MRHISLYNIISNPRHYHHTSRNPRAPAPRAPPRSLTWARTTPYPLQATVNSNLATSKETPHPTQVTMATEARLDADVNVLTKKDNQRITWSM